MAANVTTQTNSPLEGRRILLTREKPLSTEQAARLKALGASVLHVPTIQTAPPESWQPLDGAIEQIRVYDWLIFTSANAVAYFADRLYRKLGGEPDLKQGPLVCAIGHATASEAERRSIQVNLLTESANSEELLQAIVDRAGGEAALRGLRMLLPRSDIARDLLPEGLTRLGVEVDSVETYRTVAPAIDRHALLKELEARPLDVATFTSPSTVDNFVDYVGKERISEILGTALIACIGPTTAAAASAHGLRNVVYPKHPSWEALVDEIVRRLLV